jgi:ATP/maltotriose-dependent transcriptional regulator MalT
MSRGTITAAPPAPALLDAKLCPPEPRPGLIQRPRLLASLASRSARKLTIVCAPAGYGKTSLLAAWVTTGQDEAVAWLTLDQGDDEPARFWSYVAQAVDRAQPGAGRRSGALLHGRGALVEIAVNALLADLRAAGPLALVLDDFHNVEDHETLRLFGYALEHLPRDVRILIGARIDPPLALGRLRARGALAEVRSDSLAFRLDETRELFLEGEGIDLDEEELSLLVDRTEGWPVALYLAALWLRGQDDPRSRAREFAAGQRFVAEYLTEEVLGALDPGTREFLVRASVFETFSAELCDAVLDRDDSDALLTEIARINLLLVPLDAEGRWFRFHHLFDEFLALELKRTEPELAPELNRRAAAWFTANGFAEDAVEHLLNAGDHDEAAEAISDSWLTFMRASDGAALMRFVERLPTIVVLTHPELATGAALATYLARRPMHERERWLALADRARIEYPETWSATAESAASLARATAIDGDVAGAIDHARRALEIFGALGDMEGEVMSLAVLAYALYLADRTEEARECANRAIAAPDAPLRPQGVVRALGTLALLCVQEGRPDEAESKAAQALAFADENGIASSASLHIALLAQGRVLQARGRLGAAEKALELAERLSRMPEPNVAHAHALVVLAEVRTERGRVREATVALDDAERAIATLTNPGRLTAMLAAARRGIESATDTATATQEPLSPAELSVLRLLSTELSQRAIGGQLFLSVNTIKTHSRSIYRKLGVTSRGAAIARANALGLIEPTDSPG